VANFKILSRDHVNYVEAYIQNEAIMTESGAMRYMHGNVVMNSKVPGLKNLIQSTLSGTTIFKPTFEGTGKIILVSSFNEFYELMLQDDSYILESNSYWASEISVNIAAYVNNFFTGMMSGTGFVQPHVTGTGKVIISSPGVLEKVELINDRLVVNGPYIIARSANLQFSIQKPTKSIMGTLSSGEDFFVQVLEGTGSVYLAPIPNKNNIMTQMIENAMLVCMKQKK